MKRFEDYKKEVITAYKLRRDKGDLPPNLQRHTPASLKKECLDIFYERYSAPDNSTFAAFFNKQNDADQYFRRIQSADPDIFKPLNSFLRKNTEAGTHDRNIELLAWLIDFQSRPHRPASFYGQERQESDTPQQEIDTPQEIVEPAKLALVDHIDQINAPTPQIPKAFLKYGLSLWVGAFLLLAGILGAYSFYGESEQCMYWNGKQYQKLACSQKIPGKTIIALDTFRLSTFRRIENLKNINVHDIGKVHYSKVNGHLDFYTTGGENPNDHRKRLLPMSALIYEKYVLGNSAH